MLPICVLLNLMVCITPVIHHGNLYLSSSNSQISLLTITGFHIRQKSRIFVNAWAIWRDPSTWPEVEKFLPERFIWGNVDLRGRDFQLIPFRSSRRGCPGVQRGLIVVRLVVAQLVHCIDWELPDGTPPMELDMSEDFSLTNLRLSICLRS